MPCGVSHWPVEAPDFPLKLFEALTPRVGQAGQHTLVALGLMQPTAQGLASAADLGRDGTDGLPLGWVLILVLQEHPYRPLFNLWGLSDSLAHDSILSSNGVYGHPGALHGLL